MTTTKQDKVAVTAEEAIAVAFLLLAGVSMTANIYQVFHNTRQSRRMQQALTTGLKNFEKINTSKKENDPELRLKKILKTLKRKVNKRLDLSHYELSLAADVLDPKTMEESRFADIGGLDELKKEIWELVIFPLKQPEIMRAAPSLVKQPSGILLYGGKLGKK